MTTVTYVVNSPWVALTVEGHAGYAHEGQDIVCAAVSMLACTALQCMAKEHADGHMTELNAWQEKGDVRLEARATQEAAERVRVMLETVMTGFRMLEGKYPGCVQVIGEHV